jgi:hypothetical protein
VQRLVQRLGLLQPPFQANILIGKDVLDKCTFFYNGPQKSFALTWTDTS